MALALRPDLKESRLAASSILRLKIIYKTLTNFLCCCQKNYVLALTLMFTSMYNLIVIQI